MDRRGAIGLLGVLPALLGAHQAGACSLAIENPEAFTARLSQVAGLFRAWWSRDEAAFLATIYGPVTGEGEARLNALRRLAENSGELRNYGRYFTEPDRPRRIVTMTAIGDKVFVAVDEQSPRGIGPDCSGLPTLHLFLVGYSPGLASGRIATVEHIGSDTWTGHSQTASWSAA